MPIAHIGSLRGHNVFMPLVVLIFVVALAGDSLAHPLGNFTVNHFARIEISSQKAKIRYVVDMAEIAAFQEMQAAGIKSGDQQSDPNVHRYLAQRIEVLADGIILTSDGDRVT